jgi:peptidoglycan hydrolase-like protein with peptidoglycan-binding domain
MVTAMRDAEDVQLRAMVGEIVTGNLHRSLRAHDWASFARGYNGASFAVNQYDTRLAAAYQRFALGLLPDLTVRAAQIHLMYLGFDPGPVDGLPGRRTRSAVIDFQEKEGVPASGNLDEPTLELLRARAGDG